MTAELSKARVLVVDDEQGMRHFLYKTLTPLCAHVDVTRNTAEASRHLDRDHYDVILLDNVMPRQSGVDWLAEQQRIGLFSDAILMTAYADLDTAIAAIRAGASDFLLKPFRANQITNAVKQSLVRAGLRRQNSVLRHELEAMNDVLRHRRFLLGSSEEVQKVRGAIDRAAATQAHVVILGEVGSGKQVAARMLHAQSPRGEASFIWLQCYGMTEAAFQARLFGQLVEEGGDTRNQDGILMSAAGGTLFLDDVEMLPMPCQNLLLELLTTGRFRPLGAERSIPLDMRIISSASQSLKQLSEAGRFRTDLYYLLNVVEIVLPPLRTRSTDILELTEFFMQHLADGMGIPVPELSAATKRKLLAHDWPGNVIELRNFVERALIHNDFETGLESAEARITETLAAVERRHILQVLDACGGNRAEAARRLGLARKTIDRKCQVWGL